MAMAMAHGAMAMIYGWWAFTVKFKAVNWDLASLKPPFTFWTTLKGRIGGINHFHLAVLGMLQVQEVTLEWVWEPLQSSVWKVLKGCEKSILVCLSCRS